MLLARFISLIEDTAHIHSYLVRIGEKHIYVLIIQLAKRKQPANEFHLRPVDSFIRRTANPCRWSGKWITESGIVFNAMRPRRQWEKWIHNG